MATLTKDFKFYLILGSSDNKEIIYPISRGISAEVGFYLFGNMDSSICANIPSLDNYSVKSPNLIFKPLIYDINNQQVEEVDIDIQQSLLNLKDVQGNLLQINDTQVFVPNKLVLENDTPYTDDAQINLIGINLYYRYSLPSNINYDSDNNKLTAEFTQINEIPLVSIDLTKAIKDLPIQNINGVNVIQIPDDYKNIKFRVEIYNSFGV